MAKFNYWRELHRARLEAEWTFRTRQIELLKEQIELNEGYLWTDELEGAIACTERIGRKLDRMADEDSMEPKFSVNDIFLKDADADIYQSYKWSDVNGNEHIRNLFGCLTIMKEDNDND